MIDWEDPKTLSGLINNLLSLLSTGSFMVFSSLFLSWWFVICIGKLTMIYKLCKNQYRCIFNLPNSNRWVCMTKTRIHLRLFCFFAWCPSSTEHKPMLVSWVVSFMHSNINYSHVSHHLYELRTHSNGVCFMFQSVLIFAFNNLDIASI